jgi:DNA repair exonuclease SbcCD ATPase subunit
VPQAAAADVSGIPLIRPKDIFDRMRDQLQAECFRADKLARQLATAKRLNDELTARVAALEDCVEELQRKLADAERGRRFRRLAQELKGDLSPEEWEAIKREID